MSLRRPKLRLWPTRKQAWMNLPIRLRRTRSQNRLRGWRRRRRSHTRLRSPDRRIPRIRRCRRRRHACRWRGLRDTSRHLQRRRNRRGTGPESRHGEEACSSRSGNRRIFLLISTSGGSARVPEWNCGAARSCVIDVAGPLANRRSVCERGDGCGVSQYEESCRYMMYCLQGVARRRDVPGTARRMTSSACFSGTPSS